MKFKNVAKLGIPKLLGEDRIKFFEYTGSHISTPLFSGFGNIFLLTKLKLQLHNTPGKQLPKTKKSVIFHFSSSCWHLLNYTQNLIFQNKHFLKVHKTHIWLVTGRNMTNPWKGYLTLKSIHKYDSTHALD